jgi:hypothetical protein
MARSYRTMADVLDADEAILDAAWTAHGVRHQCPADGACEARQVLKAALAHIRELRVLNHEPAQAGGQHRCRHEQDSPLGQDPAAAPGW